MAASPLEIRAFRRSTDLADVADLWATALAPDWPVLADGLELLRSGYVAVRDGRCVGMVGVAVDDVVLPRSEGSSGGGGGGEGDGAPTSSVRFLAVTPDERRQGIATRLVEHALGDLRRRGVRQVAAGSGAGPYIWPGVPLDRQDAVGFFDALGWEEPQVVTDLTADLRDDGFGEQLAGFAPPAGIALAVAVPDQRPRIVEFEDAHFPWWTRWYREPGHDVLVATDESGDIVGTLLFSGPGHVTVYWPLLGDDSAEISCVGVASSQEGRGVGSAMVARASLELQARDAGVCHIGWVERVAFYRRVGYTPWRQYSMRSRTL